MPRPPMSKRAKRIRNIGYMVAAAFTLWLVIVLGSSLIRGLIEGEVYDPQTNERFQPEDGRD